MAASETLTIRIPKDVKAQLQAAAAKDDRSVTSFVMRAIKAMIARPDAIDEIIEYEQELKGIPDLLDPRPRKRRKP